VVVVEQTRVVVELPVVVGPVVDVELVEVVLVVDEAVVESAKS